MSNSVYGLSPALFFFIRVSCEAVVSQRKFGTFIAYVAYTEQKHAEKQRRSFLSSRVPLLGGEVFLSLQIQLLSCHRQIMYCSCFPPQASGVCFAQGEAAISPLLWHMHICSEPGTHRWWQGTQMATLLWPRCNATCPVNPVSVGSVLSYSRSPCRAIPIPPTSPLLMVLCAGC